MGDLLLNQHAGYGHDAKGIENFYLYDRNARIRKALNRFLPLQCGGQNQSVGVEGDGRGYRSDVGDPIAACRSQVAERNSVDQADELVRQFRHADLQPPSSRLLMGVRREGAPLGCQEPALSTLFNEAPATQLRLVWQQALDAQLALDADEGDDVVATEHAQ